MRVTGIYQEVAAETRWISARMMIVTSIALTVAAGFLFWYNTSSPAAKQAVANVNVTEADSLSRQGQAASAFTVYNEALRLHPESSKAYFGRALLHEDLNHIQSAIADFTRALELSPQLASAYYHRGFLYHLLGKNAEARADFDKAVALAPQDEQAFLRRAAFSAKLADYPQANADYTQALALQPNDLTAHVLRGAVRSEMGDRQGAAEDARVVNGRHGDPEGEFSAASVPEAQM